MENHITVAEFIIQYLESKNIIWVPGIPGGTILPLYHALGKSKIKHILARHEQGAGFIAQGRARTSNSVTPVFVSSGPGVANLFTAVADAFRDSVPLIVFSGQVPTDLIGTDAFQELDTTRIVQSITKKAYHVQNPNDIPYVLEEAFVIAMEGKKGPVWIDIPKDIQTARIDFGISQSNLPKETKLNIQTVDPTELENFVHNFFKLLECSKYPLLYIGGGAKSHPTYKKLREFVNRFQIPVVSTLMGLGIFTKDDPTYLGMMGMHGTTDANESLAKCDLLIALGVRFDDRATGKIESFCNQAKIIHVDISRREIGKNKIPDLSISCDLSLVLDSLLMYKGDEILGENNWFIKHPKSKGILDAKSDFFECLDSMVTGERFILTDVGQHQMWVAQHFPFKNPGEWITSGGQGTMGFGIPTSIGVALTQEKATVLCFTGDGSIMMNLQELATVAEHNLNIKIILFNNHHLGLVKQQQDLFYGKIHSGSKFDYQPNFKLLAKSFGIPYIQKNEFGADLEMEEGLKNFGPLLIEVEIPMELGVYPFVPGGKSNQEFLLGPVEASL
ncbi:biosynthetic-type acetolactate synthase large subunit [Leptospira sp. 96542]|nr:biosynthetic-type acetolactate synthase large subunit [Leptospira sp. 96542]